MHQVKSSKTPTNVSIPSAVFRPLGQWCVSKGDLDKIRFEWNIQQFALLTVNRAYKSTDFQGKEVPAKLKLDLSIRSDLVRVNLYGVEPYAKSRIKIAILNQRREEVTQLKKTGEPNPRLYIDSYSYEIGEQLAYDSLLSDGSLTICCEIEKRIDKNSESNSNEIAVATSCVQPVNGIDQFTTPMERLFEDMKFSDVTLSVLGRQFQAHKCILTSSSKVFSAMFEHQTKEKLSNHVKIEDIQPEVFNELLRFIYIGRLNLAAMETMAAKLLVAADKYLLDQLKYECEVHLLRRMSADNCMELLLLVSDQIHSVDNLKQGAIDFFQLFPGEVMATDGWKKAKQDHPNHQVWSLILEIVEKILRH
jgi:speckle-type POZ protein